MRKLFCAAAFAVFATLAVQQAGAAVFAAELSRVDNGNGTYTLNYRLNEAADTGVTIEILGPAPATTVVRTINVGVQAAGPQSVVWDGKGDGDATLAAGTYSWRVTAADPGPGAAYTQISDDAQVALQFFAPNGVTVDTNPASPRFGRVYISNGAPGTANAGGANRAVGNGLYILGNDLSDITAQGDTAYTGGQTFGASASPFRCRLDEEGNLFFSDWSDTNSGIYIADPANPSAPWTQLFDPSVTRASSGLRTDLHGSISGFFVEGTGASRTIYWVDEDLANTGSVWKNVIGTASSGINSGTTVAYDDGAHGNKIINFSGNVLRDAAGTGFWISQNRASEVAANPCVFHYNAATNTVDWTSQANGGGRLNNLGQYGAIALNPSKTLLAAAGAGYLRVFDVSVFPTVTEVMTANLNPAGNNSRDVAFDAAGNIYVTNQTNMRLRVFSPPGANSYTTPAPAAQALNLNSGVNDWDMY